MLGLQSSTAATSECPPGMETNANGKCMKTTKPVAVLKTGNRDQYINIDPKNIPGKEYTGNKDKNLTVAIQKSLAKINSRLNNIQTLKKNTGNIGDKINTLVPGSNNSSGSNNNSSGSNNNSSGSNSNNQRGGTKRRKQKLRMKKRKKTLRRRRA